LIFCFKSFIFERTGQENRLTPNYFYEKYNLNIDYLDQDKILKNENIVEEEVPIIGVDDNFEDKPF
jgi:hypothetical protein